MSAAEPLGYPTRLQIVHNSPGFQLWAYPHQRQPNTLIQLPTAIPAIVDYISGPTWRTELNAQPRPHPRLSVPQSNWTDEDETALALRMLRGGGAVIDVSYAHGVLWLYDDGFSSRTYAEKQKKYIFGWPEDGGVWVLALPPLLQKHIEQTIDFGEELARTEGEAERRVSHVYDGSVHYGELVESETMGQFCEKLKDAGAVYWKEVGECAEVVGEGLLDAETALRKRHVLR
jgi:hypothetical protein